MGYIDCLKLFLIIFELNLINNEKNNANPFNEYSYVSC
jgi:hypothetical protein